MSQASERRLSVGMLPPLPAAKESGTLTGQRVDSKGGKLTDHPLNTHTNTRTRTDACSSSKPNRVVSDSLRGPALPSASHSIVTHSDLAEEELMGQICVWPSIICMLLKPNYSLGNYFFS